MKIWPRGALCCASLVFILAGQVHAATVLEPSLKEAAGRYEISPSSHINFSVGQVGGSSGIKGNFGKFSGTLNLDAGDVSHSVVTFSLMPQSVSAGEERVDNFLKSTAVFDAANFNAISFRSSDIKQTGPGTATVTGVLTAKGHTRNETFDVKLTSWNGRSIAFDVRGDILRSRYGMDVGTPIYSNVVRFEMAIEGQKK